MGTKCPCLRGARHIESQTNGLKKERESTLDVHFTEMSAL